MSKIGPYRPPNAVDWAERIGEREGFEAFVHNPERRGYVAGNMANPERDTSVSADEHARRIRRDIALQTWHCDPSITTPFEEYWRKIQTEV